MMGSLQISILKSVEEPLCWTCSIVHLAGLSHRAALYPCKECKHMKQAHVPPACHSMVGACSASREISVEI